MYEPIERIPSKEALRWESDTLHRRYSQETLPEARGEGVDSWRMPQNDTDIVLHRGGENRIHCRGMKMKCGRWQSWKAE